MTANGLSKYQQLRVNGFTTFEQVLDPPMLDELRRVTDALLEEQSAADREKYRYQGSNIQLTYQHPVLAKLFAWPNALEALKNLGYLEPKWWSAFLLSKPPKAPPLYWHQDWWAWDDPISAIGYPAQLFLMYYLTDTSVENGCLQLIPGTHRKRIALHDELPSAHGDETYHAELDSVQFVDHPDAVNVMVKAGDLVVGDARLLHAAHANQTDKHRTCLTLWYVPDFDVLTDSMKAYIARKKPMQAPDWWEGDAGDAVKPLIPLYDGDAEPVTWNRIPGKYLVP